MVTNHHLENLQCYQLSLELAVDAELVAQLFRERHNYALCDQLRRASISVPANIAEGFGRSTSKEFARFIEISRGSAYEMEALLDLGHRLGYLSADQHEVIRGKLSLTLGKLTAFHKYLRSSTAPYLEDNRRR